MQLTARGIERLHIAPGERQQDVKDDATRGLYLRLFATGRRSYVYRYKLAGKVRVLTLGDAQRLTLADARRLAHEAAAKVRAGDDPGAQAQKAAAERRRMPTVAEFAEEYIARYAKPRKKSWGEDRRMLGNWVLPRIGKLKLDAVHRRDVVAVLDACRDAGNVRMPGKVLAVVRRMFRFAVERGVLEQSPVTYVTERQPKPARRAMTPEQMRTWWTGADGTHSAVPRPVALALRLLLLTGQRPGEVAALRVAELDLDAPEGPVWRMPAERRKRGIEHAVALTEQAEAVVREALELCDGVHLFPNATGGPGRVDSGLNRALRLIFGNVSGRPTPHAARHTLATELEALGLDEGEIARVLGHQSRGITGRVYVNRRSLTAQRRTLEAWERRLDEILGWQRSTNVVSLPGRN
jgi:integrase